MHGIALNVNNDFGLFRKMVPCGISGRGVSSLDVELENPPSISEVKAVFAKELGDLLSKKNIELMPFTENMLQSH